MPPRVNGKIKAAEVRLVDENGAELGVFSLSDALALAQSHNIDLIEIDPESTPPPCQVIDYGKYRYRVGRQPGVGE